MNEIVYTSSLNKIFMWNKKKAREGNCTAKPQHTVFFERFVVHFVSRKECAKFRLLVVRLKTKTNWRKSPTKNPYKLTRAIPSSSNLRPKIVGHLFDASWAERKKKLPRNTTNRNETKEKKFELIKSYAQFITARRLRLHDTLTAQSRV